MWNKRGDGDGFEKWGQKTGKKSRDERVEGDMWTGEIQKNKIENVSCLKAYFAQK